MANTPNPRARPRVAVHKFSSCDGCQLAFLNAGEALLELSELVEFVHFAEAGIIDEQAAADIAFVEGSISTPEEVERIQAVRANSRFLISIGACATAGGIQALRNMHNAQAWITAIYSKPEFISALPTATPMTAHVRVDFELWGCPISTDQIMTTLRSLLYGVMPVDHNESVCLSCKRSGAVCVLVTRREPCMGPVTRTGCGALCPRYGRDCYGCYGPNENPNTEALSRRFAGFGLLPAHIARRFAFINNSAPAFAEAAAREQEKAP